MYLGELLSDRMQKRQRAEAERRERIFNDKVRTIGIDKEALDMQLVEKKKQEEAAEKEQQAYDAEILHNSRVLTLLHRKQQKEKRAMEKALVTHQHQRQQPCSQWECEHNDPDDGQMMLPGLAGEDSHFKIRQQKQKDQLRQWLIQQKSDQTAQRCQQKLEEWLQDQDRVEIDNKALELQSAEVQTRAAVALATKEHNLAMMEEQKERRHLDGLTKPSSTRVGVPGLRTERTASPERLQQIVQFQKHQMEEKQRKELQIKQEEERCDRVRLDSAHTALLMERQQARLIRETRCHLDRTNAKLAQKQKEQRPDIKRGHIDESFFTQFNTCSR